MGGPAALPRPGKWVTGARNAATSLALCAEDPRACLRPRATLYSSRSLTALPPRLPPRLTSWRSSPDKCQLFTHETRRASADPYVLNSIGNCHASLGEWPEAREAYSTAARVFQASSGFRGRGGSTTQRVDGAIFAQANAALARAQLGDLAGARKELEYVARRGPGSVDARAALAALYYHEGRQSAAEGQWEFACDSISVGCGKYRSREWLEGVRRWPPVMVELLGEFLELRRGEGAAQR